MMLLNRVIPRRFLLAALPLALSACALAPTYERPDVEVGSSYKELAPGWKVAAPRDVDSSDWWRTFGDAELDELVRQVEVDNQNIARAVAAYAQAQALVREQRASFFPSLNLSGGVTRADRGSAGGAGNTAQVSLGGSWEPDVWGRLRLGATVSEANAQASAADLAAARLSAQAEVVTNYLSLRAADAELALLATTVEGYERTLQIAQNRYDAGVAGKSDVLQAQTQLANTRAEVLSRQNQRAQLEHAVALLTGKVPANFSIAPRAEWRTQVPEVPMVLPSQLLERRPDIATAERAVAAANAQIGIQRAAYFPTLGLSASVGSSASSLSSLFSASNLLWSVGISAAQTVFNAGATSARVDSAIANRDATAARYRQTVLTAFQSVEDLLSTQRTLEAQETLRREASAAADDVERQALNRYRAGQIGYTEVVTAQASALNARRSLLQLLSSRQTTAVALIQALGGGWDSGAASTP